MVRGRRGGRTTPLRLFTISAISGSRLGRRGEVRLCPVSCLPRNLRDRVEGRVSRRNGTTQQRNGLLRPGRRALGDELEQVGHAPVAVADLLFHHLADLGAHPVGDPDHFAAVLDQPFERRLGGSSRQRKQVRGVLDVGQRLGRAGGAVDRAADGRDVQAGELFGRCNQRLTDRIQSLYLYTLQFEELTW